MEWIDFAAINSTAAARPAGNLAAQPSPTQSMEPRKKKKKGFHLRAEVVEGKKCQPSLIPQRRYPQMYVVMVVACCQWQRSLLYYHVLASPSSSLCTSLPPPDSVAGQARPALPYPYLTCSKLGCVRRWLGLASSLLVKKPKLGSKRRLSVMYGADTHCF